MEKPRKCIFRVSRRLSFSYFPMVALDDEGAPQYLLEFLWIMLKYSVQTLCNILGGALCEKKKKKKNESS